MKCPDPQWDSPCPDAEWCQQGGPCDMARFVEAKKDPPE